MSDPLAYGNRVTFQVYGSSILGNNFRNVQVLAICHADDTRQYNYDPIAQHHTLYSHLPKEVQAATPDRYNAYPYLVFGMPNGQRKVIGRPFIVDSSIQIGGNQTGYLEIPDINSDDLRAIGKAIAGMGFKVSKSELA